MFLEKITLFSLFNPLVTLAILLPSQNEKRLRKWKTFRFQNFHVFPLLLPCLFIYFFRNVTMLSWGNWSSIIHFLQQKPSSEPFILCVLVHESESAVRCCFILQNARMLHWNSLSGIAHAFKMQINDKNRDLNVLKM